MFMSRNLCTLLSCFFLYVYVRDNAFVCFMNYKICYPLSLASINCSFSTNQSQTHCPSSYETKSEAKSPIHSPSSFQTKSKDKSQYHSPSSYQTITEPKSQTQPPSSYQTSIPISSLIKKKFISSITNMASSSQNPFEESLDTFDQYFEQYFDQTFENLTIGHQEEARKQRKKTSLY